jgi:hypothetical protein
MQIDKKINWTILAGLRGLLAFTVVIVHYKGIANVTSLDNFIGIWET